MRQLGLKPSDTELEDIMNEIDSDHSGTIDFNGILHPIKANPYHHLLLQIPSSPLLPPTINPHLAPAHPPHPTLTNPPLTNPYPPEFATIMAHKVAQSDSDAELRAAFRVFDKDDNGTIDTAELRQLMKSIGEDLTDEQIEEMIREADQDGDGSIDCKFGFLWNRV